VVIELLATAHTWRGGDGPYTVAPILGLLLTLLLIRAVLRIRIGAAVVAIAAVVGTLFATLGGRWGYTATLLVWVMTFALLAYVRRTAGPLRRNLSD